MHSIALGIVLFISTLGFAHEKPFHIDLPLKCAFGKECFIQNYVDAHRESNPSDPKDYKCGSLVYSGHKGTDFRIKTLQDMKKGVDILAVADGNIKAIRNDMKEGLSIDSQDVKGRECGNGLVIDHGNGWETQYCHMQEGSVKLTVGSSVKKGEVLGQVGMSGQTQFPHVHLSIRKDGAIVDPFIGVVDKTTQCGKELKSLWSPAAQAQVIPYQSSGVLGGGFTSQFPSQETIMEGQHLNDSLTSSVNQLIFWVYLFGIQKGDEEEFILTDPDDKIILKKRMPAAKANKATWLSFVGKKNTKSPSNKKQEPEQDKGVLDSFQKLFDASTYSFSSSSLKEGKYKGSYRLIRKDKAGKEETVIQFKKGVKITQ